MANIKKIKEGTATIYPATIPQAVVDPTSGKTVRTELDEKADQTELDQLAGEVNLLDAVQGAKIKDIENVLSTANLNQSAQLSVSGRKTISLPKNASNGGMQVKLEGLTAEQLMTNGDFKTNLSGWQSESSTSVWDNGSLINTASGVEPSVYGRIAKTIPIYPKQGVKLYVSADVTALTTMPQSIQILTRNGSSTPIGTTSLNNPSVGVKYRLSDVKELTADYNLGVRIYVAQLYSSPSEALGKEMRVDNVKVINLTATFGAGNEPDLATCDAMFSDYFEGVKSFVPTGRVRSEIGGRNLLSNLPANWEQGAIAINTGIKVDSSSFIRTINPLLIVGNSTYIFSTELPTLSYVVFYTSDMTFISSTTKPVANSKISIITPQNAAFVLITIRKDPQTNITPTNIIEIKTKLEKGTKATDWTPAPEDVLAGTVKGTGTSLYLTAPELRSNGAVKDEIRKGSNGYELVKRVGVGTLGSELVTNGTFDTDTGWTKSLNSTISNGLLNIDTQSQQLTYQPLIVAVGSLVRLECDIMVQDGDVNVFLSHDVNLRQVQTTWINMTKHIVAYGIITTQTNRIYVYTGGNGFRGTIDNISIKILTPNAGEGEPTATAFMDNGNYTLATPEIIPISYGGVLNSAENGTVYHEPIIADAGVYGTNMPILLTDYPIASIEEIIKHEGGVDTYLNASTAVIAPDGLSFTHPDLASGDLVLFTYAFDKESTNGNITATFYDSNVVKIDTVTGKAYKINEVVTNGVLTRTLTEV